MLIVFITVCLALHMQSAVNLTFIGPYTVNILQYISNKMQLHTVYYIWKRLYMFRMVPPPIIRSANNCIYSIWYLSDRYCYLPLAVSSYNKLCKVASCWIYPWLISNLMHKILIYLHIIHLLKSSTCFEHYLAHLQEVYVDLLKMSRVMLETCRGF